ncbi:MAG: SulP family inorganic anion transporter, partial [Nodosilinea sp.]
FSPPEVALSVFTLLVLFFYPKQLKRFVPPQLVVLVAGTLLAIALFANADLRLIGEIPTGLPSLQLPIFSAAQLQTMLINGLVLGMLGCIDALLTAMIADSITRTQSDANKELIGQGIGNLASGLFGGMPGAGATMGTVVNIQSGGRTALSGLVRAGILLVVVLWAAPLTKAIPLAVLAGIAVKVGFDILDWSFLKRAHNVSWKGTAIMYGVMFLTVFVDLIVAVGVGVFIANILTIDRLSKLQSDQVKAITDFDEDLPLTEEDRALMDQADGRVLVFHLSGPMIFGVARAISQEHTAMDAHEVLIIDLQDVPHLGVTAALALENAIQDAADAGRPVFLAGAQGKSLDRLENLGVLKHVPPDHLAVNRTEALKAAVRLLAVRDGVRAPQVAGDPGSTAI